MPASEDYTPLDTLKRYLEYRPLGNDPWTNTMRGTAPAPGQGFAPAGADPILYPTASPLVNITEGDIKRATDVGLAASGGGLKGQQIKAYHSSPHDFEKFDLGKIGTGEGAQVYGHGLYFAENPAVSGQGGQYWNQFLRRFKGHEESAARELSSEGFNREQTMERINKQINSAIDRGETSSPYINDRIQALKLLESGQPVGPRTYEVNINADPARMLDWDKPLRGHAEPTRESLFNALDEPAFKDMTAVSSYRRALEGSPLPVNWEPTGQNLYEAMRGTSRTGRAKDLAVPASEALNMNGIPGIRYLDEGSRGASPYNIIPTGSGNYIVRGNKYSNIADAQQAKAAADAAYETERTSNYVVFNPSIIDIVKKYGLAGLTAPPAIAGAMNQERQP